MSYDVVCMHPARGSVLAMFEWPADPVRGAYVDALLGPDQPDAPKPLIVRMRDGVVISRHPYTEALHWALDAAITPPPQPQQFNEGNG